MKPLGSARHAVLLAASAALLSACGESSVLPLQAETVTITASTTDPIVGERVQLTATARTATGVELPGRPIRWSSSDPSILRVDSAGLAVAVSPGHSMIQAEVDGRIGELRIDVRPIPVARLVISPDSLVLFPGRARSISVATLDSAGRDLMRTVEWTVADTTIARVSNGGTVLALREGTTSITALSEGVSASVPVSVRSGALIVAERRIGGPGFSTFLPDGTVVDSLFAVQGNVPRWMPDGRSVLHLRWLGAPRSPMPYTFVTDLQGASQLVADLQTGWAHVPAPDGIYLNGSGIWKVDAPGGTPRRVYFGTDSTSTDVLEDVTRDGRRFLFTRYVPATGLFRLLVVDGYGGSESLLVEDTWIADPRFSPDGNRVAFIRGTGEQVSTVEVMHATGSNPRVLLSRPLVDGSSRPLWGLSWSPDGSRLVVGLYGDGLHIVDVATGTATRIPGTEEYVAPDWYSW